MAGQGLQNAPGNMNKAADDAYGQSDQYRQQAYGIMPTSARGMNPLEGLMAAIAAVADPRGNASQAFQTGLHGALQSQAANANQQAQARQQSLLGLADVAAGRGKRADDTVKEFRQASQFMQKQSLDREQGIADNKNKLDIAQLGYKKGIDVAGLNNTAKTGIAKLHEDAKTAATLMGVNAKQAAQAVRMILGGSPDDKANGYRMLKGANPAMANLSDDAIELAANQYTPLQMQQMAAASLSDARATGVGLDNTYKTQSMADRVKTAHSNALNAAAKVGLTTGEADLLHKRVANYDKEFQLRVAEAAARVRKIDSDIADGSEDPMPLMKEKSSLLAHQLSVNKAQVDSLEKKYKGNPPSMDDPDQADDASRLQILYHERQSIAKSFKGLTRQLDGMGGGQGQKGGDAIEVRPLGGAQPPPGFQGLPGVVGAPTNMGAPTQTTGPHSNIGGNYIAGDPRGLLPGRGGVQGAPTNMAGSRAPIIGAGSQLSKDRAEGLALIKQHPEIGYKIRARFKTKYGANIDG